VDSMRDEKTIQSYRCLPVKLALIAIFALFFALVLGLSFIPLCSRIQAQSQTIPVRREIGVSAPRRGNRLAKDRFCSREVIVPDIGDHAMIDRNPSEHQKALTRVTSKVDPAPLRAESCSRV
jgi:hypothetical protein